MLTLLLLTWMSRADRYLWRVTRGRTVNHVYGTVHADAEISEDALMAIGNARVVYLEIDPDGDFTPYLYLPEGQSLREQIGPELWELAVERLRTGGIAVPEVELDRLTVRALEALIRSAVSPMEEGEIVDAEISRVATLLGKPRRFLDSLEDLVTNTSELRNLLTTDAAIRHRADARDFTTHFESRRLAPALIKMRPHLAGAAEDLARRNEIWMTKTETDFRKGGVFLAGGVAHLVGRKGLLARLRDDGHHLQIETCAQNL